MPQLPFEIPKSFASYAEQFDGQPEKTIRRLQEQFDRQGPNAVGFFLLAWFHHLRDENEEAVTWAHRAHIHAPGSPFLRKLHYYLSHPEMFDAWTASEDSSFPPSRNRTRDAHGEPVLDLDALIGRLSSVESKRIQPSGDEASVRSEESSDGDVDDIISDTLADIHARQGKTELAIRAYKRLKRRNKENKDFYSEQIRKLKKQREEQASKSREREKQDGE
ncbi:MAG: hypothetical protein U5K31_13150 [Balneolaceae bacterium]|nr:hypothetical protein [Balneolaceae bacterium]